MVGTDLEAATPQSSTPQESCCSRIGIASIVLMILGLVFVILGGVHLSVSRALDESTTGGALGIGCGAFVFLLGLRAALPW